MDDYFQVIKTPMDLSTIMTRINAHHYNSCAHYLKDIDLITNNCLEYNPDRDQYDKLLRNRACELRDVAYQLVNDDLDPEFEKVRKKHSFTLELVFPTVNSCLSMLQNNTTFRHRKTGDWPTKTLHFCLPFGFVFIRMRS